MANKIDIPNGWEVKKLGEVCDVRDGTHESPKFVNNGFPLLTSKNIINGKLDFTNINYITEKDFININRRSKVDNGDILMAMIGTIGNAVIINTNKEFAIKNVALLKFYENKSFNKFIYYLLSSQYYAKQVHQSIKGGTQKFYALGDIRNTNIPIPPLAEQEKIAEILSLWDKAIEQTKELIAYKEKQKKGLMQNLLTGKKRLHGFTDDWKTTKLGDIFKITSAGVDKKILEHEIKINLLNYMDIYNNNLISNKIINFMTSAPKNKILNCNILKGDVFLTPSSETRDDIAHSSVAIEDLQDTVYSYHIVRLRPKEQINLLFSKYMFDNNFFRKQAYSLCEGSGQRYVLSLSILNHLKLKIPTSLDEQKAIADILCKADEEIELLKKQLDLYMEQKKGLMQNLLTGKVRVTV